MEVEFHPEAAAEFTAASGFYEEEVLGLGDAFITELERVAELIKQNPSIGSPIDEIFRRVGLVRFPFSTVSLLSH